MPEQVDSGSVPGHLTTTMVPLSRVPNPQMLRVKK